MEEEKSEEEEVEEEEVIEEKQDMQTGRLTYGSEVTGINFCS